MFLLQGRIDDNVEITPYKIVSQIVQYFKYILYVHVKYAMHAESIVIMLLLINSHPEVEIIMTVYQTERY